MADRGFAAEVKAATEYGFAPVLIDRDALDHRIEPSEALSRTRISEPGAAVYRGWMLTSQAYTALHDALMARGVRLLSNPRSYKACHHAPCSYAYLSAFMPKTVWVTADKLDDRVAIQSALMEFGDSAVIIKDWVKSQAAGYWSEACYIARASDDEQASRIIARFRELQAETLVGGIVFKSYVPLVPVGAPAYEHRAFIIGGRVIGCWPPSAEAKKCGAPPMGLLERVATSLPSPFASADFGVDEAGRWWLLEVGDGQVSGLPVDSAAEPLFRSLA